MKYLSILFLSFLIASCGHKGDKNDPLYKEVMVIHDEAMPKLSTIHKIKKILKKDSNSNNKEVVNLISDLTKGKDAMMDWMHQFDPPADGVERKKYLEAQLISVQIMADKINSAIANAENYINSKK